MYTVRVTEFASESPIERTLTTDNRGMALDAAYALFVRRELPRQIEVEDDVHHVIAASYDPNSGLAGWWEEI